MTVRDAVRRAQRQLASLDAAYAHALVRLERAEAGRAVALAEHDRRVRDAQAKVERALADMVTAVGPTTAAELLGVEITEARRAARKARPEDVGEAPPAAGEE